MNGRTPRHSLTTAKVNAKRVEGDKTLHAQTNATNQGAHRTDSLTSTLTSSIPETPLDSAIQIVLDKDALPQLVAQEHGSHNDMAAHLLLLKQEEPSSLGVLPSSWTCKKNCQCRPRLLLNALKITNIADSFGNRSQLRTKLWDFASGKTTEQFPMHIRGHEALIMQNLLDHVAENGSEDATLHCHRLMQYLARKSGWLPSSLFLQGVRQISQTPVTGGGFADIFLGEYNRTTVAMKILRTHVNQAEKEQVIRECYEEALTWRRSKHPRILEFLGIAACVQTGICFVSPWMKHGNIAAYLKANPQAKPLDLMEHVAEAVGYLHSRHFNHGDIKAANILIDDHGDAKLSDMGLTTLSVSQAFNSKKSHGGGSSRWMSPELFDDDSPRITYESDIYAYGMTLYEVLSGKVPFHGLRNEFTIISKVRKGERPPKPGSSEALYPISQDVWSISEACWKHAPNLRCKIPEVLSMFEALRAFTVSRRDALSPYTYHVIVYDGEEYNSPYHLWEAMKYMERRPISARRIRKCAKINDVIRLVQQLGNAVEDGVRPDWEQVMVEKMEEVLSLKLKFHPELKKSLLETGTLDIRYQSDSDLFWGHSTTKKSSNHLGKCLERIRDKLRETPS